MLAQALWPDVVARTRAVELAESARADLPTGADEALTKAIDAGLAAHRNAEDDTLARRPR